MRGRNQTLLLARPGPRVRGRRCRRVAIGRRSRRAVRTRLTRLGVSAFQLSPAAAMSGRAFLFRRHKGPFLSVNLSRRSVFHTVLMLAEMPSSARIQVRSSSSVMSGCRVTCAVIEWSCPASFGGVCDLCAPGVTSPSRSRRCRALTTYEALIPNLPAT